MLRKQNHFIATFSLLTLIAAAPRPAAANDVMPQRGLVELGAYGGAFWASSDHALYDRTLPHQQLEDVSGVVGLRLAYLPWSFIGLEVEGEVMPVAETASGQQIVLYGVRGHLLAQYPMRISPFLVVGGGLMGVMSDDNELGNDVDASIHLGGGLKWYATRALAIRVDAREVVTPRLGGDRRATGHFELLGGVSAVFGWKDPAPADSDGDGVPDASDKCPNEPADTEDGCPIRDRDGDGVLDPQDRCPDVAAATEDGCPPPDRDGDGVLDADDKCPDVAAKTEDGCPPPDRDGDGVPDATDKCPDVAAKTEDGCPPDTDGDGITDDKDKCVDEPETKNGFEDADGCPDQLPKQVKRFTGAIKGIYFATGSAKIRMLSFKTLDAAVKVLKEYQDLRMTIRGHTDSRGKRDYNLELSRKRAQSVKDYFVKEGVADDRLVVEGLGPDEPVADNKTKSGRGKNRRIEFKLITQ